jgi:hypothetical protein
LPLGAGEADAPVALGEGTVGRRGWTGVEREVPVRFYDRIGYAERARHVPVVFALGIDCTDILAVVELEWQADAVARFDITLAVRDSIEHEATGNGAEGVGLIFAYLEELG